MMKLLKYRWFFSFIVIVFCHLSLSAKDIKKQYVIATASAGGTYYPVGIGMATIANKKFSDTNNIFFSAVTSAGSVENINLLQNGEADFAIIQGLFGSMAWQGKAKYKGDVKKNLRAISMLWHEVEQFVINSKYVTTGNIQDIKNLSGRSFSIGGKNSGTKVSTEIILDALAIPSDQMNLEYLGYTAGANALYAGGIDGMNPLGGVPTPAICNVFIKLGPQKIKMLEFTKEDLLKVNKNYPIWIPYVIKADTYPEQKKDIHTIAQPSLLVVTKDTSEETVYLLTKTIYENLPFLHSVHAATKSISLDKAIDGLPMPLHPGAAKFYREKGMKIQESLILE